ncbi:MAG: SDR family oxidoreductase [Anaerolineales bacterium]|nr:MAG: SDR family oxidoreductase [Anaerolineales bacterium]
MAGKFCLVTGATAGIGKVTATGLAARGANLIISGRDQKKTEDTVQQIISRTGNKKIDFLVADFSDLDQVRVMAKTYRERYSRLDVLVNNAGAFYNSRIKTPYGVEMTFLVNHLAPFLLTNLLLDTIKNSAPARIVNVSSEGHKQDQMNFDDLGFEKGFFGMKAYGRSKLANILFTYELARRLADSGVVVNALHPGHVATDIWKTNFPLIGPALKWLMGRIALTPEEGAENSIYLACSPDVEGITGKYFDKHEPVQSSPISYDQKAARRLWEISEKLTDLSSG